MKTTNDETIGVVAAMLVLFSALLDPIVTVIVTVGALVVFLIRLLRRGGGQPVA